MPSDRNGNLFVKAARPFLPSPDDTLKSVGGQIASVAYGGAVTLAVLVFVARKLGPASLGIYLYLHAAAALFAILQDGGFQTILFREEVSPSGELGLSTGRLLSSYFGYLSLVTTFGAGLILVLPIPHRGGYLLALGYFFLLCLTNQVSSILKGQGAFLRDARWRIRVHTANAIPVLAITFWTDASPETIFLGGIIGQLLVLATKTGRSTLAPMTWGLPSGAIRKSSFSFIVISAASAVYFKSGIILLRHLQPDLGLVGQYGTAFRFLEGISLFITPVAHVCFRSLRLAAPDRSLFLGRQRRILTAATGISLVIIVAGSFLASPLISLAFGAKFLPAARLFPILLPALLFLLPNAVLAQSLIALNGENYYAIIALLCAVFSVGGNLLLIPRFGAAGAAWTTVATEFLLTLLLGIRLRRWRWAEADTPLL
jgi:O-antigen/teichoic acid export membrane protein